MKTLPNDKSILPIGLTVEDPPFVPRMVMTSELKTIVDEVVTQWSHLDAFDGLRKYGIRPLDRLLLCGPPGNGKTMACHWIARELQVPMYRVLCNQLHGQCLGQTTKAVAELVEYLNSRTEPALCLFDEVDAIFVNRKSSVGECDRELASALTVFMQELDRWKAPTLIVMATNLIEQLDFALLSRVEMQIEFLGPTADQAEQLIAYWAELLCDNGGDEWGPKMIEQVHAGHIHDSFRELQQSVARTARAWTASRWT